MNDPNNNPGRSPKELDKRLKDVSTSDLTESHINEDFVDWLKKRGPFWLAVVAISLATYTFMNRYQQQQIIERQSGWLALQDALNSGLPASLEDVATTYEDTDGLNWLAKSYAADNYMQAIQTKQSLESGVDDTEELTDEQREQYLAAAETLYRQVAIEAEKNIEDRNAKILIKFTALCGQASIEESRGNKENALEIYKNAAEITEDEYPSLSEQATSRASSIENYSLDTKLIKSINYKKNKLEPTNININPELQNIINQKNEPPSNG